jgi:hypothetical protein
MDTNKTSAILAHALKANVIVYCNNLQAQMSECNQLIWCTITETTPASKATQL